MLKYRHKEVRFIRKDGRVIPIRVKEKKKPSAKVSQRILVGSLVGGAAGSAGFAAYSGKSAKRLGIVKERLAKAERVTKRLKKSTKKLKKFKRRWEYQPGFKALGMIKAKLKKEQAKLVKADTKFRFRRNVGFRSFQTLSAFGVGTAAEKIWEIKRNKKDSNLPDFSSELVGTAAGATSLGVSEAIFRKVGHGRPLKKSLSVLAKAARRRAFGF